MNIRPPAVAGTFYPASTNALRATLQPWLQPQTTAAPRALRGLILPHAGYQYSGAIAAAGFRLLQAGDFTRVLLLCPNHRLPLLGMAVPSVDAFATPLGEVAVDRLGCQRALKLAEVQQRDDVHQLEHAIEVQLPFLQLTLAEFLLLPVVVGPCPPAAVARLIETLMSDDCLLLVSSDLSHYHNSDDAELLDGLTLRQIQSLNHDLDSEQACGCHALNGALLWAASKGLRVQLLAQGHSGQISGDNQRVVGYAALALA